MFVDREDELRRLEQAWVSDRAELVVVYGRRRVGKTALLHQFTRGHRGVLWVASLSSEAILRQSFTDTLWQIEHPETAEAGFVYASWERSLRALGELAGAKRCLVALDEFPYLVSADPSIPSVLQKVWDETLQHTRLMLILCGSHLGMMERTLLTYRAPLYGRRTGQLLLKPLPLRAAQAFFPRYGPVEQIAAYGVLGGIPAYLGQFDDRQSLLDNIAAQVLDPASYLYQEPHFLLREELQEPRHYFAILQAIAAGNTRLHEITQAAGLERGAASRYLATLQDLRLVERRVPVTEHNPAASRKGIYRLCDSFLSFWFRFVAPYPSLLEAGYAAPVLNRVQEGLGQFLSFTFEDLAREWLTERAGRGQLPFLPERIGNWWDRDTEIDLVAVSDAESAVLVGECKWWAHPVGVNVLDELKRKARLLDPTGRWPRITYLLCAKDGFTPALRALAEREGVWLLSAPELLTPNPVG